MAKRRANELTAGLFVLGTLALAMGLVLWIGAAELFRPARQTAWFAAEQSAGSLGLTVGTPVLIGDETVGRVEEVRFDPGAERTYYRVKIEREDIEIRADAEATVSVQLVGQGRLVVTSLGSPDAPRADREHPVMIGGGLGEAMEGLNELIAQLNGVAGVLRNQMMTLEGEQVLSRLPTIMAHLERGALHVAEITGNLLGETDREDPASLLAGAHRSLGHVEAASGQLERQMDPDADGTVMANVVAITHSIRRETDAKAAGSLLGTAHGVMNAVHAITSDARPKVAKMLGHAATTAENIERFTEDEIPSLFEQVREANDRILKVANDLSAVSGATREIVVLNRENIDHMIENMARVSESLKATAAEIRRSPWRLLRRPPKEEIESYDILTAASAFSQGAASLDRAVTKLEQLEGEGVAADDPQIEAIRSHLKETFAKFKAVEDALWEQMQD